MKHPTRCRTVLFILLLTLSSTAHGQESDKKNKDTDDGIFTLGEVVVSAEKGGATGAVARVDEEMLREFNRDDLSEALDLLPGVTAARTGARNERTVFVRGFDVKHVPLFMDGIPIYVMYDGYSDYGRFTTFDVSRIDVSKGAASVLYGPNTMAGAINVVTRQPQKAFEANAGAGAASGNTITAYANVGTRQDGWYAQAGASYVDRDGYDLSDDFEPSATEDGGRRENSYLTDRKFNVKIGWTPSNGDEYALSFSRQEAEKGNPPYTGYDPSEKVRYWQWPQWDKQSIYVNSRTALGSRSYLKTRLYYDKYDNSLFGYDDGTYSSQESRSAFQSWYNDDTAGGSIEIGTALLNRHDLKAALHYKHDRHKEHDLGEPRLTQRDEYYSAGVEDTIRLNACWSFLAGASYDWRNALEAQDYNSDTGEITPFAKKDVSAFNPLIGIFYDISETSTLYATIARKSRFPTLKDRYSYRFGRALPNPDLDPEYATNYDLGCEVGLGRVEITSAFFFSDVEDYIQSATIADPDDPSATLQQNRNISEVYRYGFEADVKVSLGKAFNGGLGYTYTGWDNRSNDQKITGIPEHKVNAFARYILWDRLALSMYATHYAGRYSASNGVRKTDSFTLVDISIAYKLIGGLKIEGGVNNIFDENYEIEEGYPEEGINCFANLTYRY